MWRETAAEDNCFMQLSEVGGDSTRVTELVDSRKTTIEGLSARVNQRCLTAKEYQQVCLIYTLVFHVCILGPTGRISPQCNTLYLRDDP